ncbi:hypothetical protein [Tenacibaculum sp. Ill]|uniref:hypothetical protein n=1 Tax=Tenacibaculum sp. Ill TaxID=3445935 RepID=UPI003F7A1490
MTEKVDKKNQIKEIVNSLSWVLINSLGKLKISKSSYYYLVVVPILVKVLDEIESPLQLLVFGSHLELNIKLPFSWYLFYFGAIFIAVGSIIYQLFCPELIKNYKNYGEFLNAGESDSYLEETRKRFDISIFSRFLFLEKPYIENKRKEKIEIETYHRGLKETDYKEVEKIIGYEPNIKYQEERKNYFNDLYRVVKYSNRKLIYFSFFFYVIGFIAFLWVILQNIKFVVKHLFIQ